MTKQERIKVYEKMLRYYNQSNENSDEDITMHCYFGEGRTESVFLTDGLCITSQYEGFGIDLLPELKSIGDFIEDKDDYWWPIDEEYGHTIRVMALLWAIEECKKAEE